MAKIKVVGQAVVVKSSIKFEDWLTIEKYNPSALKLYGGEDGKEEIFAVCIDKIGSGNINKFGATFDASTTDTDGKATITVKLEVAEDEDVKEAIADTIGRYVINLNKLEETLPQALAEVKSERTKILDNIDID